MRRTILTTKKKHQLANAKVLAVIAFVADKRFLETKIAENNIPGMVAAQDYLTRHLHLNLRIGDTIFAPDYPLVPLIVTHCTFVKEVVSLSDTRFVNETYRRPFIQVQAQTDIGTYVRRWVPPDLLGLDCPTAIREATTASGRVVLVTQDVGPPQAAGRALRPGVRARNERDRLAFTQQLLGDEDFERAFPAAHRRNET
jgi:hypothetical protein